MLEKMSCWPASSALEKSMALSAALVPTATKAGVSMVPWGVVILPVLARLFLDWCMILGAWGGKGGVSGRQTMNKIVFGTL